MEHTAGAGTLSTSRASFAPLGGLL